ncbi:cyclophilin-like fold protein [Mesorhizobium sp. M7A.F.Ca.ET.027.03.2.1]|uniref:cyclophilin-like fold protein n=1 Tax=Mesorhizobium sp. M7A.F.Ca.ET.027.03.2.1 TaxID=2496656 RepID=UPI001AEC846D|nr:cyclophilin-like fold protein [Mesorhizobium sp. M7A.F.Ca.ET.027.03.2.1]
MTRDAAWLSRRALLAGAASFALPSSVRSQADVATDRKGDTMRLRFIFAVQDFTATLEDNPSARDLVSMLPLDLTIDDYSTNEKIAYLPRKLTEKGSGRFGSEAVGDLCYYAPWGNLAIFHGPYRWSRGLIRLGRLDHGPPPLLLRGEHPLRVETL